MICYCFICLQNDFICYIWCCFQFQIFDGHNGSAAAIYSRDHLLNHVVNAIPRGLGRDEWLQALPRALVAGFVKTDKEFQSRGMSLETFMFPKS